MASEARHAAERYYDSDPADQFYRRVWGGEDIHIGLYPDDTTPIASASRATVERMASRLRIEPGCRILDLGAGYGGAARFLAERFGCHVTCLNLSEIQNERNRELCRAAGLDDRVEVRHGSFEDVPAYGGSFDFVWSQDAFLHSGDRRKVLSEARRVMNPGGELIFTDPMQRDGCPPDVLKPVYDRIHLESLAEPGWYRRSAEELGFEWLGFEDLTIHLRRHYARVRRELRSRYDEMIGYSTREYVDQMIAGLGHWVDAADAGYLAWGILQLRRR